MAFWKKSKEEVARKKAEEQKKAELEKILKLTELKIPTREEIVRYPREYAEFLREVKQKPTTFYEKACAFAEKLNIKPDVKTAEKIDESAKAAFLNVSPTGALSLTVLVAVLLLAGSFASLIFFGLTFGFVCLLVAGCFIYWLYSYPESQARMMSMRMSSDSVLAILYMVIYMRTSPNLEGALKFASENLVGPLSWDLKKLIWDIEMGKYPTADAALVDYIGKWKEKNEEFANALHNLRISVGSSGERLSALLTETISIILVGTRERTKHYAAGLRMPMMLVHAMGVLLPVMGLVLFPIVLIFMSDVVKPAFIFIGYNIILPVALWFLTANVLKTKPPTFSQPDVSECKGVPPLGKIAIGKTIIPIWPISFAAAFPIAAFAFGGLGAAGPVGVNFSILLIVALSTAISSYCLIDAWQKIKVRNDIEKIEDEFSQALFQLGNQISGGVPLELAIDKARENLKDMKIAELFSIISLNMRKFGYTFEQALFDKEVGALWYFPSHLIKSIMQIVTESAKKGITVAGAAMLTIAGYLKNVHDVKEEIGEILGETLSSMKFLAMFLAPMVAGVTVTMAVIIMQILESMGAAMSGLMGASTTPAQSMMIVPWAMGGTMPITPAAFQLVVGLYMVQTAILLSLFLNRIEYGEDAVGERSLLGKILIAGTFVYILSWFITYSMFGSSISALLTPIT